VPLEAVGPLVAFGRQGADSLIERLGCKRRFGFDAIQLQHLYRTTGFLHDVRNELERQLFLRDRDLFLQYPSCCSSRRCCCTSIARRRRDTASVATRAIAAAPCRSSCCAWR